MSAFAYQGTNSHLVAIPPADGEAAPACPRAPLYLRAIYWYQTTRHPLLAGAGRLAAGLVEVQAVLTRPALAYLRHHLIQVPLLLCFVRSRPHDVHSAFVHLRTCPRYGNILVVCPCDTHDFRDDLDGR